MLHNAKDLEGCHVADAREGNNDWKELGYGRPRPPDGELHYIFRLYALDHKLDLPNGASRADVGRALHANVLAEAELMGRFATPVQAGCDAR